jgi:hypothetical protein
LHRLGPITRLLSPSGKIEVGTTWTLEGGRI